jgi:hypothetical protein
MRIFLTHFYKSKLALDRTIALSHYSVEVKPFVLMGIFRAWVNLELFLLSGFFILIFYLYFSNFYL